MAQTSFPFENLDTSETQFSQWARNIGEGVRPGSGGELLVSGDGSGMNVKVAAGQSLVRGHYYVSTAIETLIISASDLTNPRIDNVVLELDPAANTILLKVVAGTPAGSPSAPSLVQTDSGIYQQLLATVAVAASATVISSGNVTDARTTLVVPAEVARKTVSIRNTTANTAITASDNGNIVRLTGSTGRTITIDNVLVVGQGVDFLQDGSGQITFDAGSGVTLVSVDGKLKTNKQYSGATVRCVASGVYHLIGDLGA
jgi:hypothetical protein